jgi:hypothetical protein
MLLLWASSLSQILKSHSPLNCENNDLFHLLEYAIIVGFCVSKTIKCYYAYYFFLLAQKDKSTLKYRKYTLTHPDVPMPNVEF